MKNYNGYTMVIAADSCGDELEEFVSWMNKNHSEVEVSVGNVLHGTTLDNNGNNVDSFFWEMYCNE